METQETRDGDHSAQTPVPDGTLKRGGCCLMYWTGWVLWALLLAVSFTGAFVFLHSSTSSCIDAGGVVSQGSSMFGRFYPIGVFVPLSHSQCAKVVWDSAPMVFGAAFFFPSFGFAMLGLAFLAIYNMSHPSRTGGTAKPVHQVARTLVAPHHAYRRHTSRSI